MIEYLPFGGAQEVGASCGLIQLGPHRILVDAGMRPAARPGQSRTPDLGLLEATPPHAIIITHAHIDHTGCLPLVAALFPDIPIYATESTRALMRILLLDSARIMAFERLANEAETPLYTQEQVEATLGRVIPLAFDQAFAPIPSAPDIVVQYLRAGHILGAGMLLFTTSWGTILHTGDISTGDHRTIKGVDLERLPQADLMICEGTYGNRTHGSRKDQERGVVETVQAAINRGGHVLIPAFAVGRAQEVILILKSFRAAGVLSPIKIFVDGMCKAVCEAYEQQAHDLHPALQKYLRSSQRPIFMDQTFGVHGVSRKMRASLIAHPEPYVVISTSGMLSGGPAPLYAAAFAQSDRNAIVFTGYQDEEAPGALLLRTKQGDHIPLNGQTVQLQCQVHRYSLSGHADANQIEQVVKLVRPRTLVLVHGDQQALTALAQRFRKLHVVIPGNGERIVFAGGDTPARATPALTARVEPIVIAPAAPAPGPEPTVEDLYAAVMVHAVPPRPWTTTELGQSLYQAAYHPGLRRSIEQALQEPGPYFKLRRLGSQKVYVPQSREYIDAFRQRPAPASAPAPVEAPPALVLEPGMIVLVQGAGIGQGAAHLGCVLGLHDDGRVELIAEGWKGQLHPATVVRLLTGMTRPDWCSQPAADVKQSLVVWRAAVNRIEADLVAAWYAAQGAAQTFAELTATLATDDERLAFGLDLLQRGVILWIPEGQVWIPKPIDAIHGRESIERHISLLMQRGRRVQHKNGQTGVLTGRGAWGKIELAWDSAHPPAYVKDKDVTLLEGEG